MADKFVRPTSGSDANSGADHANAYQTVQKALDMTGGDDTIYISNEAAITLDGVGAEADADLNWTLHNLNDGHLSDDPLIIQGYDDASGDSVTPALATLDGTDSLNHAHIFSDTAAPGWTILRKMYLKSTTGTLFECVDEWCCIGCKLEDGDTLFDLDNNAIFVHCELVGPTSVCTAWDSILFLWCEFHGFTSSVIEIVSSGAIFLECLFYDIANDTLDPVDKMTTLINCTFVGNSAAGDSAVTMARNYTVWCVALNNIFMNWGDSGSGGAFDWGENNESFVVRGYNHYYNNDSDDENDARVFIDLENDQTTDPEFTDTAGGNFATGLNARRKGYPTSMPAGTTDTFKNTGAAQRQERGLIQIRE